MPHSATKTNQPDGFPVGAEAYVRMAIDHGTGELVYNGDLIPVRILRGAERDTRHAMGPDGRELDREYSMYGQEVLTLATWGPIPSGSTIFCRLSDLVPLSYGVAR